MRVLSIIIGIIFVLFAVSFSVVNTQIVDVVLPFVGFSLFVPLYLVVLFVAVISFLLGGAFVWLHLIETLWRKKSLKKEEYLKKEEQKKESIEG